MDKYYVYRPLLDLIGKTEGTDRGRGYNETLGYGAYTGGEVTLTAMTLPEVDALQTRMLQHPKNKFNSSAAGRYQIVRTTRRAIEAALPDRYPSDRLFDEACQDEMACYLLGQRGIDKYLAGRLGEDTLLENLAKEWASLPTPEGKGYYDGQRAAASPADVRAVLEAVKRRHREGQPVKVPETLEEEVQQKSNWWQWLTGLIGSGGLGLGWLSGMNWDAIVAGGAILIIVIAMFVVFNQQIIRAIKHAREELR